MCWVNFKSCAFYSSCMYYEYAMCFKLQRVHSVQHDLYISFAVCVQLIVLSRTLNVPNKIITCTIKLNIYSMKLIMCCIILHARSIKITTNTLKLERHNITLSNFGQNGTLSSLSRHLTIDQIAS